LQSFACSAHPSERHDINITNNTKIERDASDLPFVASRWNFVSLEIVLPLFASKWEQVQIKLLETLQICEVPLSFVWDSRIPKLFQKTLSHMRKIAVKSRSFSFGKCNDDSKLVKNFYTVKQIQGWNLRS
jgi:hypothetical protein